MRPNVAQLFGNKTESFLCSFDHGLKDDLGVHAVTQNGSLVGTPSPKTGSHCYSNTGIDTVYNINVSSVSDFTLDAWFYVTHSSDSSSFVSLGDFNSDTHYVFLQGGGNIIAGGPYITAGIFASGSSVVIADFVPSSINTWHHAAVVKVGSAVYLFRNGSLVTSGTVSGTIQDTPSLKMGKSSIVTYNEYIDHLRLIKGKAILNPAGFSLNDAELVYPPGTLN